MNSHLNKEIFSETGCVNKEILLRYRDAKLRDSEKHEVEKHLVDCPLCTEALEGFALLTGTSSFDEVNERLAELSKNSEAVGFNRYVAIAASVAAVVTLSYFAFKQFRDVPAERLAESEISVQHDSMLSQNSHDVVQSTEGTLTDSAPASEQVHKPDQIIVTQRLAQANQQQDEALAQNETASAIQNTEVVHPQELYQSTSAESMDSKGNDGDAVKEVSTYSASPAAGYTSNITYVDNRKVIDYSENAKDKESAAKQEKSVSSKYENQLKKVEQENDEVQSGMEVKRKTSYVHLLDAPIKMYNAGNYSAAIKEFDKLLELNPADENARFYKGMSLYNMAKYDEAINLLLPLSKINTQPFSEEALFYVGKSHAAMNENSKATKIFKSIINNGGFYKDKAIIELNKLH